MQAQFNSGKDYPSLGGVVVRYFTRGKIDYNGQFILNPWVIQNLQQLRLGLDINGYSNVEIVVTGGDSVYDQASGKSISLSDLKPVKGREETSAHNVHNGARDVDVRLEGIPDNDVKTIVGEYTDFRRMGNDYPDDYPVSHWHLGLPERFSWCPEGGCK